MAPGQARSLLPSPGPGAGSAGAAEQQSANVREKGCVLPPQLGVLGSGLFMLNAFQIQDKEHFVSYGQVLKKKKKKTTKQGA